ncbi:hypothetical protein EB232_06610 [Mesorhizobium sp. NZP2077]|nr:hypothetical protein EB232_06610 [Mesorhizobium sp. NZP2077]
MRNTLPTALLPYCPTALLPYCPTALLPYCPTALLPYCPAALLPCCPAALLPIPQTNPVPPRISPHEPDLRRARLPFRTCLHPGRRYSRRLVADRAPLSADR